MQEKIFLCLDRRGRFELETGKLPHQVAAEVLGDGIPMAVLSGPTFAREVGAGLPTALTVASRDPEYAMQLARSLSGPQVRAYASDDVVGVELCGALKNVIAIAAGMVEGVGLGHNALAALLTRGLAEISRLTLAAATAAA